MKTIEYILHYVLRAWKSFNVASWVQIPIFKTKIAKGIQKWVQTNQFQVPPVSDFFKLLFSVPKIIKKMTFLTLDGIFEINQKALICLGAFRFEMGPLQKKLG